MVAMNASNQDLDVTVQVRAKHHVGDDRDVFDQAPVARPKRSQRPTNKKSLGEAEFI